MIIFVNTDMFSTNTTFRDIFADHNISVMRIEGNRRSICFTRNSQCSVDAEKMRKMKNFYATVILIRLKRISKFAFRGVLSLRYLFIRLFCYRDYHPIQLKLLNWSAKSHASNSFKTQVIVAFCLDNRHTTCSTRPTDKQHWSTEVLLPADSTKE